MDISHFLTLAILLIPVIGVGALLVALIRFLNRH